MCSTPQSGSHIAGLVVLVGAVQGAPCKGGQVGGIRGKCARADDAPTAEERAVCARCACCAAVLRAGVRTQPRAEVLGGKLLGSVAQHGTYCGLRGTRSVGGSQGDWATGAGYEGAVRAAGAISAAPRLRGGSGGRGRIVGIAPERVYELRRRAELSSVSSVLSLLQGDWLLVRLHIVFERLHMNTHLRSPHSAPPRIAQSSDVGAGRRQAAWRRPCYHRENCAFLCGHG